MSTNAPSKVKEFPETSLEKIAYKAVASVPTREPNDQARLGYHVWRMLSERRETIAQAVHGAGARMLLSEKKAVSIIGEALKKEGISIE